MSGCSRTCANSALVSGAGLVEDPVGDRELADVVQQRGAAQVAQLRVVRAERARQADHDQARAIGVPVGPRRLGVDHARERVGDPVQLRVVGASAAGPSGSHGADVAVVRASPRTPRRRGSVPSASTSAGSNQPPRRLRATRQAALDAARGVEDLDRLGEAEDPPEQRDLLAAQPARLAAAVPVLVERADRLGGRGLEAEHAARSRRRGRSAPASARASPRPRP